MLRILVEPSKPFLNVDRCKLDEIRDNIERKIVRLSERLTNLDSSFGEGASHADTVCPS